MAMPGKTTGLTYRDLDAMFPEDDKVIRELIDGELFVTPPPTTRHQGVVIRLAAELQMYAKQHGGKVFPAPTGVYLDESSLVEPDVIFIRADHLDRIERPFVRGAPDLVVEISSLSTRKRDVTKRRDLYERFGVAEYWFIDIDADRVEVYRLVEGRFEGPKILGRDAVLGPREIAGFAFSVDELLGPPED